MIASNASWDKEKCSFAANHSAARAVEHPDRGPRILDDPLAGARTRLLPAFSILLFADAVIAAIVARMNSENVTLWILPARSPDGLRRDDF